MSGGLPSGHLSSAPAAPDGAGWHSLSKQRLVEISTDGARGAMSSAVHAVACWQARGETVAWVQPQGGPLYPPDLHDSGVDLQALVVVHVPPGAGAFGLPRAAEILLRSGAYGLVILDLTATVPPGGGAAWQGRLLGLARQHHSSVVLLTHKPAQAASLGALVGWRVTPQRRPMGERMFLLDHVVLKNKTGLTWPEVSLQRRGPWGMW